MPGKEPDFAPFFKCAGTAFTDTDNVFPLWQIKYLVLISIAYVYNVYGMVNLYLTSKCIPDGTV
jgi:hypothetical protein